MLPGSLLLKLSQSGIHLLPVDEDAKKAGVIITQEKKDAEERAILDIACTARSFHYKSYDGNKNLEKNVAIRCRENLEYDEKFLEDDESDWSHVQWWPNKVALMNYADEKHNRPIYERVKDGHLTHSMWSLAVDKGFSAEANMRC